MTVISIRASVPRPSIAELVSRAESIRPLVRGLAEQTENNRQVSAEAIARMREAGLFRIMQPAIYGGYEYGFDALVRAVTPVAAGCGSSGWVFSLGIAHQWLAARFRSRRRTNSFPIRMRCRGLLCAGRQGRCRRRRLSPFGDLEFHQRLRSRPVAFPRRNDPAGQGGRAADARFFPASARGCAF